MARLSDTESEDWMAEPGRPFAAATKAASKASVPKGAAFPVAAEAGAVQGKSAMAWRDWTKPKPAGSVPGPAACAQDKNPKRNKTDLEKQSAVATAVAKKGAEAAEAAVRLATLAAKQMAQSLATPQRAAPKERSVELPTVEKQTQQPPRDAVQQQQAPGSSKGEDSEKVRERSPAGKDETDGPKPKKARAAWGSVGCFAGRRPPTDDESKESFELKRKLWSESRSALEKKYPGQAYERRGDKDGFAGGLLVLLARPHEEDLERQRQEARCQGHKGRRQQGYPGSFPALEIQSGPGAVSAE